MKRKIIAIIVASFILYITTATALSAQALGQEKSENAVDINIAQLEEYVDDVIPEKMSELGIAGVAISVVKDDEIVLNKGYGYQDIENQIKINPSKSMFSIGSTSKVFVFTSVMQLVEKGVVDLNTDIQKYLDFELKTTYDEPITLNHLLDHTAGFEETTFEMIARDVVDAIPLGEWLEKHVPDQIFKPGEFSAYSNYGTALAAYIVQLQSGMPYGRYIQEYILDPLNMKYTVVDQLDHPLFDDCITEEYGLDNGELYKKSPVVWNVVPAGGMKSSAEDMAKFLIMHMNNGEYEGIKVLKPETIELMHSTSFIHDPSVAGLAHGLWEGNYKGVEYIGHGGDTLNAHTNWTIIKQLDLGIFITCNSSTSNPLTMSFFTMILEEFYKDQLVENIDPKVDIPLERFVGTYLSNRSAFNTALKASNILSYSTISKNDDGTLDLDGDTLIPIDELIFRNTVDGSLFVFTEDNSGNIQNLFYENYPAISFQKEEGLEKSNIHKMMLIICVFVFITALLVFVVRLILNKIMKKESKTNLFGVSAILSLISIVPLIALIVTMIDEQAYGCGEVVFAKIALLFPFVFIVGLIYLVYRTIKLWILGNSGIFLRLYMSIVSIVGIVYILWLYTYNLIGWHLG